VITLQDINRFRQIFGITSRWAKLARQVEKTKPFEIEKLAPLMKGWADEVLLSLHLNVITTGASPASTPSLFLGNHISYLDIPVLLSLAPVSFVAKSELARWPVMGASARAIGTVFVKRSSKSSRREAAPAIDDCVKKRRQSVALFPSGTTTIDENKSWRWGAFEIAKAYEIPVQPFRICYRPLRQVAYLEKDMFAPHLWNVLKEKRIEAFVEFHEPVRVEDPKEDSVRWWRWSRQSLHRKLSELGLPTQFDPFFETSGSNDLPSPNL
jgi:1-acyl-sn-glycerol-3-phosphate acyltransferase